MERKDLHSVDVKIGCWIVETEDGVYCSAFTDTYFFSTKMEAIKDYGDAHLDARKSPKVQRIAAGVYLYTPKSCDGEGWLSSVQIVRVTGRNIEKIRELIRVQDSTDE